MKYKKLAESAAKALMELDGLNENWEGEDSETRKRTQGDRLKRNWLSNKREWDTETSRGARPTGSHPNAFEDVTIDGRKYAHFPRRGKIFHKGKQSDENLETKQSIAQMGDTALYVALLNNSSWDFESRLIEDELEKRAENGNERARKLLMSLRRRDVARRGPWSYYDRSINGLYSITPTMKASDEKFKKEWLEPVRKYVKDWEDYKASGHKTPKPEGNGWDFSNAQERLRKWKDSGMLDFEDDDGVAESYQPQTLKEDYESETCDWCDAGGDEMRDICDWIEDLVDYDDLEWREQQAIDGLCEEGGYVCKTCAKKLINRALRGVEERETGYTEPEFDEMSVDDKDDNPEGWETPETFQDDNALPGDF